MDYFAPDHFVSPSRGDLLISEPYLPDPNFERTVVFLCEHDDNGTFGFVLNKSSQSQLPELIEEAEGFDSPVFIGGPVQQNTLHFLHRGTLNFKGDREIVKGVHWGIDFENVLSAINTRQLSTDDLKFFVGYSGWAPGQLEEELEAKSWIVYKSTTQEMVFDMDPSDLWRQSLSQMGGKFRVISNYPTDPRLN